MLNFVTFFLWALAACLLWRGSLAKDQQSHYVCLLDDPDPNHCDSFCLNELRPLLKQVIKGQGRGITCDADKETKEKLGRLVGQEARLRSQLQGVEAKMEGRLEEVQAKLEGRLHEVQAKLEAKLEGNLLAVQTSFEDTLHGVLNQLLAELKKIFVANEETTELVWNEVSGFERIGSRYFKIVKEKVNWDTAERRCREMGGYLAAFRNEKEINAISVKLVLFGSYWLGLNYRDSEGHFVSVASHKPAKFLKWGPRQPSDVVNNENCVYLWADEMWDSSCNDKYYFICQSDNKT